MPVRHRPTLKLSAPPRFPGSNMPLILNAGPSAEPVALDEAKLHCRVDGDAENTLVASLILAARMHVERSLDLALIGQSWSLFLDRWPDAPYVELPLAPLISLDAIRLHGPTDSFVTLDPGLFITDRASRRPRIARNDGQSWPLPGRSVNGIEIVFTAGYGPDADDVPMPLRIAIRQLVAHWYEAREPVAFGEAAYQVPASVASLVAPFRSVKL
jgi:uncharacterized phiE125 gp8 family phage protein